MSLFHFSLIVTRSVFTPLSLHSYVCEDAVNACCATMSATVVRGVCRRRCGPCRTASDRLRRLSKLHKSDTRVRRARARHLLLLRCVRPTSDTGSRLAWRLRSLTARPAEAHSHRRRRKSNANCRNGWVRRPAVKLLKRRSWKTVRFSRDDYFHLYCRCFVQQCRFSCCVLNVIKLELDCKARLSIRLFDDV